MTMMRYLGIVSLAVAAVVLSGGCKKSTPAPSAAEPPAAPASGIARVHWLGKKRIAAETNAAFFMTLWNLPESANLEAQTLDKLSLAPWHLLPRETNAQAPITNYQSLITGPSALLRPLLDDLVQEESFLEARHATNQPVELAFAIRLDDRRTALWGTGLAGVIEALPGLNAARAGPPGGSRWSFRSAGGTNFIEMSRAGQWTIVGLGQESNSLPAELRTRIQRDQVPFPVRPVNFWLEAEIDLPAMFSELLIDPAPPGNLPALVMNLIGDGQNVHTRAELAFRQPIALEMEPWNIPTNLVHDPLVGFSAIRGIRPWLKSFKPWNDLDLGTPPNQAFFWAQSGGPALHFMALPSAEASNQVNKLEEFVLSRVNPMIASNRLGTFQGAPGSQRLLWHGIPWFSPTLDFQEPGGSPFIFAGMSSSGPTNKPIPAELLAQIYAATNLVWYDWELTQPCASGLLTMAQMARNVFGLARLAPTTGLPWLVAAGPKLRNTATALRLLAPTRLSFSRTSGMGFTGAELQILVDWLESPEFPRGLHTFVAPGEPPPTARRPRGTESVPATGSSTNAAAPSSSSSAPIPGATNPPAPPQ